MQSWDHLNQLGYLLKIQGPGPQLRPTESGVGPENQHFADQGILKLTRLWKSLDLRTKDLTFSEKAGPGEIPNIFRPYFLSITLSLLC